MVLMPADFPSYGLDEWQAIAGTDEEDRMVHPGIDDNAGQGQCVCGSPARILEDQCHLCRQPEHLSLGDGAEKLYAQLKHLARHHRLTHAEITQMKHISLDLASVSSRPTKLRQRA